MGNIEFATSVVLVGITIVFLTLIGLTLVFMLYGKVVDGITGRNKGGTKPPAPPKKTPKTSSPAPVVEQGISDDVIAAISAAIAYMMDEGSAGYAVRSIKRASQPRREWRMAGMIQNTRPF
ncbi:MAG: OadG family transporter subunit [Acetanaerobacterium sp.]